MHIHIQAPELPDTTPDGTSIDYVDTSAADEGFKEWVEKCWIPRIYATSSRGAGGGKVRLDPNHHPDKRQPADQTDPASPAATRGYSRFGAEDEEGLVHFPSPQAMPLSSDSPTPRTRCCSRMNDHVASEEAGEWPESEHFA